MLWSERRRRRLRCSSRNELYTSLRTWLKISPHTVLFVLLPPLLFEDAASIQYFVFRRVCVPQDAVVARCLNVALCELSQRGH